MSSSNWPAVHAAPPIAITHTHTGALFATVGCVKALCFLLGSSFYNTLYPATVHFMKGFSLLLSAFILLLPTGIIG